MYIKKPKLETETRWNRIAQPQNGTKKKKKKKTNTQKVRGKSFLFNFFAIFRTDTYDHYIAIQLLYSRAPAVTQCQIHNEGTCNTCVSMRKECFTLLLNDSGRCIGEQYSSIWIKTLMSRNG